MKTIQLSIAVLMLTLFSISCSKEDTAPTPTKQPSAEVSFENIDGIQIGDDSSVGSFLEVTSSGIISNVNKMVLEMYVSHNNQKDLSFNLKAPDGTMSYFIKRVGGTGDYVGSNKLRFSAAFTNRLSNDGTNFPSGNYKESQGSGEFATPVLLPIFSTFKDKSITGNWKLFIIDNVNNGIDGEVFSWKIIFEEGALN